MSENILVGIDMATVDSEFESWWESDGQYCRSGGGSYEKTFAYRAYEAAIAKANGFFAPMVPGYTAVDMANAAADGFRDGVASMEAKLKGAYRAGWNASGEGWNAEYPGDAHEKESWVTKMEAALSAMSKED